MNNNMRYEFIAPCHFGMEAVLKREILNLGLEPVKVEDGKVTFAGDETAFARANVFLRTTERILLKVGSFKATSFDELFEGTKALPWENYIPKDGRFWVTKANSVRSALFSPSDIQSIMKKAMVERLKSKYKISWFEETGADYAVRVSILKDEVTVGIDTSGESLHRRGYRKLTSKAPITETLAAALILHTPWKADRLLVDPFCGSGTIPIEAALIGLNIAPGMKREFAAEKFAFLNKAVFDNARTEARDLIQPDRELQIQGYDIDSDIINAARQNARLAGVESKIHFQARDVKDLSSQKKYGFIITNPPYGERLEEKEALPPLYTAMGKAFNALDSWSYFIISSYEDAEKYIGRKADKNRKLYNGMLKSYFYEFMGPRPPKKPAQS
ncbi:MAG: class I SAM-dependent RNA methyltransferase [Lachnospiraceae bacterium]|nr:class I SAM-dependent RNA methyltransferase [Lachnospiraceae bacterium]